MSLNKKKTRQAPSESATLFREGAIKQGNDGNMWIIVKTASGVHRWSRIIKKDQINTKSYLILDNGGHPFLVYVKKDNSSVSVYKRDPNLNIDDNDISIKSKNNKWIYTKLIKTFHKPLKIFIGKSPLNDMTKLSRGYGPKFDGNTILLQISQKKYIYIGSAIKEYTIPEQIIKYISPVGYSSVPYPYGTDYENNYYLLEEDVSVSNVPKEYIEDPYGYYYMIQRDKLGKMIGKPLKFKTIQERIYY